VADFGLVVPFLDDSPAFAAGVRLGMSYAKVRRLPTRRTRYVEFLPEADEEQHRLMMHRLGWSVHRRQIIGGWVTIGYRRMGQHPGEK